MKEERDCQQCGKPFQWHSWSDCTFCSKRCYHASISPRMSFWPQVQIGADDECWMWTGATDKDGYGTHRIGNKQRSNQVAYLLMEGEIPEGLLICHTCDKPGCCNPTHLFAGTPMDNMRDKVAKKRQYIAVSELSPWAKLKVDQVLEIRRLHSCGETQRKIATQFGVGFKAINKIVHRQRWKNI